MDTNLTSRNAPDAEARQEREKLERRQEIEKLEDLQRTGAITQELAEIKDAIREASGRVRRMEHRVASVLPPSATALRVPMRQLRTLEETHRLIDHLIERAAAGERIEDELSNYAVERGLIEIAQELGLPYSRPLPRDDLIPVIAARLRQSACVWKWINE